MTIVVSVFVTLASEVAAGTVGEPMQGTISNEGFTPSPGANAANTGTMVAVVAVAICSAAQLLILYESIEIVAGRRKHEEASG